MAAYTTDLTADETKVLLSGRTRLHGIFALNGDDAVRYIQLFNAGDTDDVTLGTTPPDVVIPLHASSVGAQSTSTFDIVFFTGLVYAVTTTATGNTGPTADAVITFVYE